MKLKAVVNENCNREVVDALESLGFRYAVMTRVLKPHLKVRSLGPAEFYIQGCDFAIGNEPMCEVRLTGVSVNTRRSTEDFRNALFELELIYKEVFEEFLPATERCQLFVSMMLDMAPFGERSTLLERDPIYVEGKRLS